MKEISITLSATYFDAANFLNVGKEHSDYFSEHGQRLTVHFNEWVCNVSTQCKVNRTANRSTAPRIMFHGGAENPYRTWVQSKYKKGAVFKLYVDLQQPNHILLW